MSLIFAVGIQRIHDISDIAPDIYSNANIRINLLLNLKKYEK